MKKKEKEKKEYIRVVDHDLEPKQRMILWNGSKFILRKDEQKNMVLRLGNYPFNYGLR